jgi:hypothetical protein
LPPSDAVEPSTLREVAQVLTELAALIDESSFSAGRRLEAGRDVLERAGLGNAVRRLRVALEEFDFETARAIIDPLLAAGRDAAARP